jgi:hypothetical protein
MELGAEGNERQQQTKLLGWFSWFVWLLSEVDVEAGSSDLLRALMASATPRTPSHSWPLPLSRHQQMQPLQHTHILLDSGGSGVELTQGHSAAS